MSQLVGNHAAAAAPKAQVGPFVPLWGIALDAAVLVALIVTIARNSVFGLDFFHVLGGALWISIDLLMGFIIGPTIRRLDVPARMVFSKNPVSYTHLRAHETR